MEKVRELARGALISVLLFFNLWGAAPGNLHPLPSCALRITLHPSPSFFLPIVHHRSSSPTIVHHHPSSSIIVHHRPSSSSLVNHHLASPNISHHQPPSITRHHIRLDRCTAPVAQSHGVRAMAMHVLCCTVCATSSCNESKSI